MKIVGITIQNYGAFYASHSFVFDRKGLVLVLGENLDEPRMKSNGAAKSTIFDALDWCLFGVIPRGDHVDSIVNEDAKGNVKVQVDLESDTGSALRVIRWRKVKGHEIKPNGVQFWIGAQDQTALDDDETQDRINQALGMDREVFHALVLHAQTDIWNFAAATDAERVKILTKVLQLGQIDEWLERAKSVWALAESEVAASDRKSGDLKARLLELRGVNYKSQREGWDINQKGKIVEARQRVQLLTSGYEEAKKAIPDRAAATARLAELEKSAPRHPEHRPRPVMPTKPPMPEPVKFLPGPVPPDTSEERRLISSARSTISTVTAEIAMKRRQAEQKRKDAEQFSRTNVGVCGVCRQPISAEHVAQEVTRLTVEATEIEIGIAPLEQSRAQWEGYESALVEKIRVIDEQFAHADQQHRDSLRVVQQQHLQLMASWQAEVAKLEAEYQSVLHAHELEVRALNDQYASVLADYNSKLAHARMEVQTIGHRESEAKRSAEALDHETKRWEALSQETNPWVAKEMELGYRIQTLEQEVKTAERETETHKESLRYAEFWVKALGPKGLKNFILDSRVQELTDASNHWMKLIFGGTSWVRFETQVQGRSTGKLSNELNIRCFRYMPDGSIRERNFRSLSGGEKQRVSLAVDMGLSRIIANRATKRYDLLVLDEVFKHLDAAGREAVVDMLHQLQSEKSSIFVVDHDAQFAGAFEHRIIVRKQGGRSTIVEGTGHDQEIEGSRQQEDRKENAKAVSTRRPVSRTPVTRG